MGGPYGHPRRSSGLIDSMVVPSRDPQETERLSGGFAILNFLVSLRSWDINTLSAGARAAEVYHILGATRASFPHFEHPSLVAADNNRLDRSVVGAQMPLRFALSSFLDDFHNTCAILPVDARFV